MVKNISLKNEKNTFRSRILKCIGDKKPYPWGKSIGLSDGAVTRIFRQGNIPTWEQLLLISKDLGKSINWLLSGEEHPLDKNSRIISYLSGCNSEEQNIMDKLIEIFRNDDETHKEALTHNINLFCGDKLWIREGKPERRKKYIPMKSVLERRAKVHDYGNGNGS